MRVDTQNVNPAVKSLFENPQQVIFLDANFFIPPDRGSVGGGRIPFSKYKEYWLDPLFHAFPNLSVHETVYEELIDGSVKQFADEKIAENPSRLDVYYDSALSAHEQNLLGMQIQKLAPWSGYIPEMDNAKDRGEIRSLAYMSVKNFLYFAANDTLPVNLLKKAEENGLEGISLIQPYEILYYLRKKDGYDIKGFKMLYKYLYYLTTKEKRENPEWGEFVKAMDCLYEF